ncbi:uncharacterized protein LOC110713221 [Chenopodium quinoa]|uniref:uncharacterized protein LOC110713221 n=1 Tax=Chenopodium quinoa TaxID=63459 RepID=UPI000B787C32|nr:uncharacterized protein LOC110713221 [Chenopodium quinoa]
MNLQNLFLLLLIFFSLFELNSSATKSNNPPNMKDFLQHKGEHKADKNSLQNEEEVNNTVSDDENKANKYHYYMKKGAAGGHGGGGGSGVGRGVGGGGSNAIHHPPNYKKSNGASLEVHPLTSIILTISSMFVVHCLWSTPFLI